MSTTLGESRSPIVAQVPPRGAAPVASSDPFVTHWQFELEPSSDVWRGFSTAVSVSLEAAFLARQRQQQSAVRNGAFLYTVDFASMTESQNGCSSQKVQRIRRISVVEAPPESAPAALDAPPNSMSSSWQPLTCRVVVPPEADSRACLDCPQLQQRINELQAQLEAFGDKVEARLQQLADVACYPNRLVRVPGEDGTTRLGRIAALCCEEASVNLGAEQVQVPCAALKPCMVSELKTRPGSKLRIAAGTTDQAQAKTLVACGGVGATSVEALSQEGVLEVHVLDDVELDLPQLGQGHDGHSIQAGARVMVKQGPRGGDGDLFGVVVRIGEDNMTLRKATSSMGLDGNFEDVEVLKSSAHVDWQQDLIRPGVPVRFQRDGTVSVGLVHSVSGNGVAIVDFFEGLGLQCQLSELEVVAPTDSPFKCGFPILRWIGECQ
eukprot:CAMPEP_0206467776 /NCGR_PEP_ID=MMETSP0324_2-20121206/29229_1 /ASSEMBLY_ACC=CAM_ASM_000836 /TAXON_ID=2866 /ORGANISM="Crypthecodinium cohnii, Strain Seligo" /LENGTH=435 /DNA_ID=CAMNT_0053941095 /DNA_START=25 /DNA_END=1329 /DNA_ORIENTATION=-